MQLLTGDFAPIYKGLERQKGKPSEIITAFDFSLLTFCLEVWK